MRNLIFGASPLFDPFQSMLRSFARAAVGVTTREAMIDGDHWCWFEAGPVDGEPLILLHGFAANKDNWLLIAPILAQRYRVICPDLPGFGESGAAGTADYSIPRQAARIVGFMDALELDACHIGGNSMGGFIALLVALESAGRVRSLILLNNAGVDGPELTTAQQALKQGHDLFEIRNADDVRNLMDMLFHSPPYLPYIVCTAIAAHLARRRDLEHLILIQILVDAVDGRLNDRLDELMVPTLILWGDSDNLLHVSAADVQHAGIAGAEKVILDNTGHVPMVERPFRTAREIRSFLSRQGRAVA